MGVRLCSVGCEMGVAVSTKGVKGIRLVLPGCKMGVTSGATSVNGSTLF